jgi:hypothetical protein
MLPRFCALILLGLVWGFGVREMLASQTPNWGQIHAGMKAADVIQAVGEPLFKTGGRLYQTWIYDHAGEILLADGVVVAVTRPKSP